MKILAAIVLCIILNVIFAQKIFGASTVSATVTAQNISVSVTDGSVSYGTLSLSSTEDTTASGLNDTQTAENDGNVAEDFNISSSDASGGTGWTLSGTAIGTDQYEHKFSTNSGSTWTAMTTSYATLATNVAAAGTQDFDLQILTPSATTDYTQKTITVTVQAVAH
jgi:hypothetical protein